MSNTLGYVSLFISGLVFMYYLLWRKKGEPYASTVTAKVFLLTIMACVVSTFFK